MGSGRSLADDLRARTDEELERILRARPDLTHPVPEDFTALAVRAASGSSISRTLDKLDAFTLHVGRALALLSRGGTPVGSHDVLTACGLEREHTHEGLEALTGLIDVGLVWGDDSDLRMVTAAREMLVAPNEGLSVGREQLTAYIQTPAMLDAELANAPREVLALVSKLKKAPNGTGTISNANREVTRETAATPIEWLLARQLLVPIDSDRVALPAEIVAHLIATSGEAAAGPPRAGRATARTLGAPPPQPPDLPMRSVPASSRDRAAGQNALMAITAVAELLDAWALDPPGVLRSGGLGVRDLTSAARLLDLPEAIAAMLVESARAAGLVAGNGEIVEVFLPTPAYDAWLARRPGERWAELVWAWFDMPRQPSLAVAPAVTRANALSPDGERPMAAMLRRLTLKLLHGLPAGSAPSADIVFALADWHAPRRRGHFSDAVITDTLADAEFLGITGRGALTASGAMLLEESATGSGRFPQRGAGSQLTRLGDSIEATMPTPVDHVLLQADLTAVAPGPLLPEVSAELGLVADVESKGGATVYRFSAASVRRALDVGRSAQDVISWLGSHSKTPVPQPLAYLVEDVARRHGAIRVGAASSYIRCDDPTALDAVMVDRSAEHLKLVRLGPTAVASTASVDDVLKVLRRLGLSPVAESADGVPVIRRVDARRTPPRTKPPRIVLEPSTPDDTLVAAAVRAIRAGERARSTADGGRGPRLPRLSTVETLTLLKSSIESELTIWIGYADTHGMQTTRVVDPLRLSGGFLTCYDHRSEQIRTIPVSRITGAAQADEPQEDGSPEGA